MAKITFSHDIDENVAEIFDKVCAKLGPPKYRVLEAAIQVFASLPISLQYVLRGYDDSERKLCLDLVRELQQHSERPEHSKKAKSSKSG